MIEQLQSELSVTLDPVGAGVSCHTGEPQRVLYRLLTWAEREHVSLEAIEVVRPTLEDIFLELTGTSSLDAG